MAGLLSFFSPCILPLLPVYVGLLTTSADNREFGAAKRMAHTLAFVLGISVTFLILGLGAGAIGRALNSPIVTVACGLIIFLFGLHLTGILQIPFLNREKRVDMRKLDTGNILGAFLLGLGFSFGWTPCVGPILGTVLALAAQQGSAAAGAGLTLVYALGLSIPFLVITLAWSTLATKIRKLNQYLPVIQRVGGAIIAIMGLWMIFTQFTGAGAAFTAGNSANAPESESAVEADASEQDAPAGEITEFNRWRYIELTGIDGETHTFEEYVGKPVYIKLWGTWCSVCMSEIDDLAQVAEEHNTEGDVQVITVVAPGFYGEMPEDEFVAWAHERGLEFPILMDTNNELNEYFAVGAYPTSLFVNSSGGVELVRTGAIEHDELEQILAGLE